MRKVNYIVYRTDNYKIIAVSKWYNEYIHDNLCISRTSHKKQEGRDYINITHSKSKEILAKINKANDTHFG